MTKKKTPPKKTQEGKASPAAPQTPAPKRKNALLTQFGTYRAPDMETWTELYSLARQLKELAPWEWMSVDEIFAIADPISREKGYCLFTSASLQDASLFIYLGDKGLRSFIEFARTEFMNRDLALNQLYLALHFEERSAVRPEDRKLYKALGLKFRGRYPIFVFEEPGFMPEILNARQARFLCTVLPKIIQISRRAFEEPDYLCLSDDSILCFTPVKSGGGLVWKESQIPYVAPPRSSYSIPLLDELTVRRSIKNYSKGSAELQVDYFYLPSASKVGSRFRYPRAVLIVDAQGSALALAVSETEDELYATVLQQLLAAISKLEEIPQTLYVQRDDLEHLFKSHAQMFGFEVKLVEKMDAINAAVERLYDSMLGELP